MLKFINVAHRRSQYDPAVPQHGASLATNHLAWFGCERIRRPNHRDRRSTGQTAQTRRPTGVPTWPGLNRASGRPTLINHCLYERRCTSRHRPH